MEKRLKISRFSQGVFLVTQYVIQIFPKIEQELNRWAYFAKKIPDQELRRQAVASIAAKKFHAQGGSVYCLHPEVSDHESILRFIVAFQTISDYLDNLCDRAGVTDEQSFRRLHLALSDAADPEGKLHDYYQSYPYQNDFGYLGLLVQECRTQLLKLPAYPLIIKSLQNQIRLYSDLQALKHLNKAIREIVLMKWAKSHQHEYPNLFWWEFAAATGSTLGIFLLVAAASQKSLTVQEISQIETAYFPWVHGLHILLDYYIDTEEDRLMNDLNFTSYYRNQEQCRNRLTLFINQSIKHSADLNYPQFHRTIIQGLLAMYLSDNKARRLGNRFTTEALLNEGGSTVWFYYRCCRFLRWLKRL